MTKKKDTLDDKRIDELLISVNSIQENMADKPFVANMITETLKKYHETYNPNNLVVAKPLGMTVSGEQNTQDEGQAQGSGRAQGRQEKKEGDDWTEKLGSWGGAAREFVGLLKIWTVPPRDPRFDNIENMSIDIVTNSMSGVVRRVANDAMRQGATVHSGMTLDGHKD